MSKEEHTSLQRVYAIKDEISDNNSSVNNLRRVAFEEFVLSSRMFSRSHGRKKERESAKRSFFSIVGEKNSRQRQM